MKKRYNNVSERKIQILDVAIKLATNIGYQNITRDMLAEKAKVSSALITWYFDNMQSLKKEILKTAINQSILPIIAQGLSLGDKQTRKIPKGLKQKVLSYLA